VDLSCARPHARSVPNHAGMGRYHLELEATMIRPPVPRFPVRPVTDTLLSASSVRR
jgi:hypothetical protein